MCGGGRLEVLDRVVRQVIHEILLVRKVWGRTFQVEGTHMQRPLGGHKLGMLSTRKKTHGNISGG